MMLGRRGLTHRCIALLLAALMPLCCCVMNSITGGGCCSSPPASEAASCCTPASCCISEATSAEMPTDTPDTTSGCVCCLKAPGPVFDWTVPVDNFGVELPNVSLDVLASMPTAASAPAFAGRAPPPSWHSAAPLRGCTILNC
ncbi:MAG: hypothetical protein MK101_08485 [Phycisphaerales bacterium]|nr:hypothetical protein [Phycisphaerales bacterium]